MDEVAGQQDGGLGLVNVGGIRAVGGGFELGASDGSVAGGFGSG